ncbi:acetyl-CoA hydrolase/transferase family protein [Oceanirhabdus seepicola]|uniref:Acetyl-CoA hydrolase/transferase family protein n=1 Tax=Oceanirhabdus seepicola TaxID=2828781 RepID=A0A9J6PCA9_9CLOT|nr:acetyl-CoA hydrolase/transferase C-terminal domain-containing protein [Oceanirhabdus seepicola]MCM1992408.1 acetyl-CoA hydrolase/transferase family protein [Oceanirhabdus seepicola]
MTEFNEEYKKKLISLEEALEKVESNYEICVGLAGAEPTDFLNKLHIIGDNVENVSILTCLNMGDYKFTSDKSMEGSFVNSTWFYSALTRKSHDNHTASFIPNHLHLSSKKRLSYKKPDMYIGTVSKMDKHGYFSLSLSNCYEMDYIEAADRIVLEVNENYPRVHGDTAVHISQVDFIYESKRSVPELPTRAPSAKDKVIGKYIADLIPDGATIQLGIGGIPNAVAEFLKDKKDLGIHTEMITDGMVDLVECGAVNNRKKTIHRNKIVGTFALGTKKLYDFIDDNPMIELRRGSYTNDPYIIGKNYKMVSINTSLQIDLTGQCCSESIGIKQYSGTGGQADTAIGAQNSEGGFSVIALYSTAKKNTISTIVPMLSEGAAVSLQRNDVDYVVTEYGVAELRGRTIKERVEELIKVSHPNFREWLSKRAEELKIW